MSPQPFKTQTTPDYLFKNSLLKSNSWLRSEFEFGPFKNMKLYDKSIKNILLDYKHTFPLKFAKKALPNYKQISDEAYKNKHKSKKARIRK